MKFKFAPSLPAQLEPSTFYMIAQGEQLLEIHVTNADANDVRRVPLKEDILTNIFSQADTAPDVTGPEYFWLEPSIGMLFVKNENNGNPVWVEATPSVAIEGPKGDKGDTGPAGTTTWAGITNKPATFPPSTHTHELGKTDVGLGNVDNTADSAKPVSTAQQNALNLKANIASPALTGTPTAPTAAVGTNTTQLATTAFVQAVNAAGTGSAATAVTLKTARTINGTSFDGSVNITTVNWGTARNLTIGSTAKSVNGSANVAWSLAEIGAATASHTHDPFDRYDLAVVSTTGALNLAVAQTFKLTNNTNTVKNISVVNAPANRSMAIILQIVGKVGTVVFPQTFDFGDKTPDFTNTDTIFHIFWNGSTYYVTQNR